MGNQIGGCFWGGESKKKQTTRVVGGGLRKRGDWENGVIEQQALAMALQQQHKAQLRFERSMSNREAGIMPPRKSYSGKSGSGREEFKRSASTRARHIDDLLLDPRQLVNGSKVGWFLFTNNFPPNYHTNFSIFPLQAPCYHNLCTFPHLIPCRMKANCAPFMYCK